MSGRTRCLFLSSCARYSAWTYHTCRLIHAQRTVIYGVVIVSRILKGPIKMTALEYIIRTCSKWERSTLSQMPSRDPSVYHHWASCLMKCDYQTPQRRGYKQWVPVDAYIYFPPAWWLRTFTFMRLFGSNSIFFLTKSCKLWYGYQMSCHR